MKRDELQKVIDDFRRHGLYNGTALGHRSGVNDEIADLLEKHIPKKVKPVTRTIQKFKCCVCSYKGDECEHLKEMDGHFEYTDYVCPTCGALVSDNGTPRYCWMCGQEFTWKAEKYLQEAAE